MTPALSILVVTAMYPSSRTPGRGVFVQEQVESLRRLGSHVDVLVMEGDVTRLAYLTGALRVFFRTLARRYDVVHAHYGLTGLFATLRWRTPLIITFHGSDLMGARWQNFASRCAARFCEARILVSAHLASIVSGDVIPCGIDLDVFRPCSMSQAREALSLDPHRVYLLFPYAETNRLKGHQLAVAVVDELRRRAIDAELLVVSGATHADLALHYAASNALLVCSERESGPLTAKEAAACCRPIVSVDVGDVSSVFRDTPGVFICPRNPESLADGVVRALSVASLDSLRSAVERYDLRSTAQSVVGVYTRVLAARRRPTPSTPAASGDDCPS